MIEPNILNVQCPICALAWMLPMNERTYICPHCSYVGFERDLKEKQDAIYRAGREVKDAGASDGGSSSPRE